MLGCFALTAASWLKLSALFSNPEVNDFPSWEAGERSGRIRIQLPSSAPSGCLLPTQQPRRFVTRRWMISAAWPAALWVRTHTHTHTRLQVHRVAHTQTHFLKPARLCAHTFTHVTNAVLLLQPLTCNTKEEPQPPAFMIVYFVKILH